MKTGHLLSPLPPNHAPEEEMLDLACMAGARVERIVSRGHVSPPGFWYDQEEDEWVVVLKGRAVLEFDDPGETLVLRENDWVLIPAHRRHRVAQTANPTVWLAVFSRKEQGRAETILD